MIGKTELTLRHQWNLPNNTKLTCWANRQFDNILTITFERGEIFLINILLNGQEHLVLQDATFHRNDDTEQCSVTVIINNKKENFSINMVTDCSNENYFNKDFILDTVEVKNKILQVSIPPKKDTAYRRASRV